MCVWISGRERAWRGGAVVHLQRSRRPRPQLTARGLREDAPTLSPKPIPPYISQSHHWKEVICEQKHILQSEVATSCDLDSVRREIAKTRWWEEAGSRFARTSADVKSDDVRLEA